jgi:hypothetical protein
MPTRAPPPPRPRPRRRAVLRPGGIAANATVRRDELQGAPYFAYRAADGQTHQVRRDIWAWARQGRLPTALAA